MGNDYVERERKSNIDINERRRLLRAKQSNEMNRLRQKQQQQIHQLVQKHRDQSTELERQISYAARWIRCEIQKPHNSIEAVNRSDWRVEKWSGWRESNPLHNQNPNRQSSETVQIPSSLPFLNESHTCSANYPIVYGFGLPGDGISSRKPRFHLFRSLLPAIPFTVARFVPQALINSLFSKSVR